MKTPRNLRPEHHSGGLCKAGRHLTVRTCPDYLLLGSLNKVLQTPDARSINILTEEESRPRVFSNK